MNHKIKFKSNKPIDELKEETLTYFQEQGFKLVGSTANTVHFKRGSIVRNMVTFNPLKWKSSIKVKFEKNNVFGDFDINTKHQAVTFKEERLWKKFISNYQETIKTGKSFITENRSELRATKNSSWKYIGYAFMGAIVFGIPSGVIAYITGFESFVSIGGVSGALYFMMNKINKDKEENANK